MSKPAKKSSAKTIKKVKAPAPRQTFLGALLGLPAPPKKKPRKPHWSDVVPAVTKRCIECKKKFSSPWPNQVFCCAKCGDVNRERRNPIAKKAPAKKKRAAAK